ncbi:helix-turn-helix domain-containing protein [Streptomyces syringium]|uniref:helix-turn-helix domain-containing protein n=1 Tax=Streptomyces syringium TaxID=76729 RepID=UPI0036E05F2F
MVGGRARSRPPLELARDPETWPEAVMDDPAAAVVQSVARALDAALTSQSRSLRQAAEGSGVNRQAIADLLAGRCWPDIATVARLENFLAVPLYPHWDGTCITHQNRPPRPREQRAPGATK